MRVRRSLASALLIALLAGCAAVAGGRRDGDATSLAVVRPEPAFSRIAGRPTGPRTGAIKWQRRLEGPVVPGPVEAPDGSVLAASNGGVLHALDPRTGELRLDVRRRGVLWRRPLHQPRHAA